MQSSVHRSNRRRLGALLAGAVLAGGALTSSPAFAAPTGGAPAQQALRPAAAAPASTPAADPNAEGYDSFIVTYKETASNANSKGRALAWGKAAKAAGVSVKDLRETALGSHVIQADRTLDKSESAAFMADLKASGAVAEIEPNAIMTRTALSPVDQYYSQQWGFTGTNGMRVPGAWNHTTGSGMVIGVIDTGSTSHTDLNANTVPGYDFISSSTAARDGGGRDSNAQDEGDWYLAGECGGAPQASDSSWHGSHVAGTIAAVANTQGVVGVAPNAKVQHARVLGKCGGSLADIADAIVWSSGGSVPGVPANATPVDVINMSLGGSGTCGTTYQDAINSAVGRGVPVVVAAGNENQPAANARPANCSNTITVAATDSSGNRSSFSNYGAAVDVAAPGSSIISTVNAGRTTPTTASYANYNGTSMATPHVAGAVALMLAKNSALTPAQVESSLKTNARAIPGTCSGGCGAGLVDAAKTVGSLGSGSVDPAPTPVDPAPVTGNLVKNPGFESGTTSWTGTPSDFVITDSTAAKSGTRFGVLNGYGRSNTGTIDQTVAIPSTGASLTYSVQIGTDETTTTSRYDTMSVQVVDGVYGTYTLKAHSNLNRGGYTSHTVDLSRFAGKSVTLRFKGTEDVSNSTVFRIDDVAVTAK